MAMFSQPDTDVKLKVLNRLDLDMDICCINIKYQKANYYSMHFPDIVNAATNKILGHVYIELSLML